jgi:hydroxymethylpyrimidine pyrophosphatase-like HAD family hydrolase
MSKQKTIAFDLDDVLCFRDKKYESLGVEKYRYCVPNHDYIQLLNKLFDSGHKIIIYTARGMTHYSGDVQAIETNLRSVTEEQLKTWGARYHELVFGKRHYEVLIDDKALNSVGVTLEQITAFLQ